MSRAISLLLDSVKQQEENARLRYQKAVSDMNICQKNLDAINDYREVYSSELNEAGKSVMQTSTLTQYNGFINRLDQASADQAKNLKQAEGLVQRCRDEYQLLQTKRKGLEKLLEKEALEKQIAAAKAEQKMMDEAALHSHLRRTGEGF
jgi:flagellar FliJ protein